MKLNGQKRVDKMELRNYEENQKYLLLSDKWFFYLFTFNSRADITKYTFNQVRSFSIFSKVSWFNEIHQ